MNNKFQNVKWHLHWQFQWMHHLQFSWGQAFLFLSVQRETREVWGLAVNWSFRRKIKSAAVSALKLPAHQCDLWSVEQVWRSAPGQVNISEVDTFNCHCRNKRVWTLKAWCFSTTIFQIVNYAEFTSEQTMILHKQLKVLVVLVINDNSHW